MDDKEHIKDISISLARSDKQPWSWSSIGQRMVQLPSIRAYRAYLFITTNGYLKARELLTGWCLGSCMLKKIGSGFCSQNNIEIVRMIFHSMLP